jgi:hypothetical protein
MISDLELGIRYGIGIYGADLVNIWLMFLSFLFIGIFLDILDFGYWNWKGVRLLKFRIREQRVRKH